MLSLALEEAEKAREKGEVPVGAVIVKDGEIIARAHNLKETLKDPTAHAEILAIREACNKLNNWRLHGCEMYVTLEPCPMCAGAILQSRLSKIYIGTFDDTTGAAGSVVNILQNHNLNYFLEVVKEVLAGGSSFPEPKTIPMPQGEAPLTEREMEVLRLMCRHMTNKEIARELFISENTVKYHKMNMLGKTGFSKAVDLAFYMISNGWINPLY